MLLYPPIAKKLILGLIAPHGSTDIIHASQNKLVSKLFQIQAANLVGVQLLSMLNDGKVLDIVFLFFSVIHFRHDVSVLKKIPPFIAVLLLSNFALFGIPTVSFDDIFFLYMVFLHVPNHYIMNWNFIKKQKAESFFIVGLFSMIFLLSENNIDFSNINMNLMNAGKAFILSHIMYNEKYVYKKNVVIEENSRL